MSRATAFTCLLGRVWNKLCGCPMFFADLEFDIAGVDIARCRSFQDYVPKKVDGFTHKHDY